MKKLIMTASLIALPLGLSACDKPAETPKAEAQADAKGEMAMSTEAKMAKGSGTVTAIDTATGKITLDHGPIASLEWPAMKMGFDAKPEQLTGIAVGDMVDFDVNVTGSAGEVTAIKKK
jgi:Cu(I)/Ag(I) efflux system periplasmic protein CusF